MSTFVEALKRAYTTNFITINKLDSFLSTSKITQEEYDYILS